MSSQLRVELNRRLGKLHGAAQVYYGVANDATFPYDVYNIQPSLPSEYSANEHHQGTITPYPVLVETYATSASAAESRLAAIIQDMETTPLVLDTDIFVQTLVLTRSVTQEPEQASDGENIWRGEVIFEIWIATGR